MEEKEVKKITLGLVLGWVFGVLFLLSGLVSILSGMILEGLLILLLAIILLPPANTFIANKFNFVLSRGLKIVLILVLLVVIGTVAGNKAREEENPNKDTENSIVQDIEEGEAVEETEETPPEEVDEATLGEKNALRSAKNYLSTMAFSYTGLIKQLEFEGYTAEEATYAVDNCGADWNEQAGKSAKNYMSTMAFSKTQLITQLKYEGFTEEQAEYGAKAVGY